MPLDSGNTGHLEMYGRAGGVSAPTAAAGAGGGSAPPAPVVSTDSQDSKGQITMGTGTTAAAGVLAAVTFAQPFASIPHIILTPINLATAVKVPYVTVVTAAGFSVGLSGTPADSQANTVYGVNWLAIQ